MLTQLYAARDLTLEAAQSVHASRTSKSRSSGRAVSFTQLRRLLDSRSDRDVLEGLRKVVSVISSRIILEDED